FSLSFIPSSNYSTSASLHLASPPPPPLPHSSPFFFYYSAPPPHLHSFPTRRSSDLPISSEVAPTTMRPLARGTRYTCDPRAHRRDRKSTRLNSSHDQISYAVFCLKKKKNTN